MIDPHYSYQDSYGFTIEGKQYIWHRPGFVFHRMFNTYQMATWSNYIQEWVTVTLN
jgi:hypothetical protein